MSAETVKYPDWVRSSHLAFGFSDAHEHYVDADRWTLTATDAGTATIPDRVGGGILVAASDGTEADNDESYFHLTREMFLFAATKPLYGKSVIQYAEANTDDANIFVGFGDAFAANFLVDDGAGIKTTASAVGLLKVDGGTVWQFVTSVATAQTQTASTTTAGGSANQRIEIFVAPHTSTTLLAWASVDGAILKDSNNNDIQHTITLGTPTEMEYGYGVKNGGTNGETLSIYHTDAWQHR